MTQGNGGAVEHSDADDSCCVGGIFEEHDYDDNERKIIIITQLIPCHCH